MKCLKGKVRWFNSKLGYGFITTKELDKDIYVHYSNIKLKGFKKLLENDLVEFLYDKENNKALEVNILKKACYVKNN